MSQGDRFPLHVAKPVAEQLLRRLEPHVQRAVIAGSIRREVSDVGDIDIVVEPHFERNGEARLYQLRDVAKEFGKVSGGDRQIRLSNVLDMGLNAEIRVVQPPAQWGTILSIMTGPTDLSLELVNRLRGLGLDRKDGRVFDPATGDEVPVPDEETYFELAGLPYLRPKERNIPLSVVTDRDAFEQWRRNLESHRG